MENVDYVRGLFDAEAHIEFHKKTKAIRITFTNKDEKIVELVKRVLKSVGIKKLYCRYSSKAWRVQIYRKEDIQRYSKTIFFFYPTKASKLMGLLQRKAET